MKWGRESVGGGEGRRGKGEPLPDKLVLLFWPKKEMNAVN